MTDMTDFDTSLVPTGDIFIGGEWRQGRGNPYKSLYPADQSVNMEISTSNADDARDAVEAADAAWRRADWAGLKPHQRALILYRVADLIMAKHEALAHLQRRDNGKPISETRVLVASAANTFRYFAACLETLDDELTPARGDYMTMSVHEPIGVIAAITPWNSPIASDAQKLAPALAGGNAVVLKPAEVTPLVSLALARICEEAGVPKGVLSVLPGKGSVIGDVLVRHPLVKKVSFTGGTEVGRGIARIAADKLMPVSLELGGKSPTIVFDDADIDHAVNGVLYGISVHRARRVSQARASSCNARFTMRS
jgi:betaine-aldehyde dehydrogenase